MRPSSRRSFLAAVITLFLCRALAAGTIVPPWQGPDEPTHFSLTKLLVPSSGGRATGRDALEGRILESMARHGWWAAYQEPTPSPVPRTFREVQGHLADNVSRGSLLQPAYYAAGAAVLWLGPSMALEGEYQLLRLLSVALTVATLLCGWAGTRLLFGDAVAAGAIGLAALHPQLLLTALAVNPDALINLCGAVMWWQAARLHVGMGSRSGALLAIVVAAAVAALSKRNGVPLVPVAFALVALTVAGPLRGMARRRVAAAAAGAGLAAGLSAVLLWDWIGPAVQPVVGFLSGGIVIRRSPADLSVPGAAAFLKTSIDTAWLVAGWMRFPAPEWWMWIARGLTVAGVAGAAWAWTRGDAVRRSLSLAWMFVVLHAGPLLLVAFVLVSVPQGRYLFGVFVPAAALLIVGIQQWCPSHARQRVAVGTIALLAFLDAAGFARVLVPAYLS